MLDTRKISDIANEYGTPLYILDKESLGKRVGEIRDILGSDVTLCFAMKANPFLVDAFKSLDTKYEVCSPGEFAICEREQVDMDKIVLSGVNKEKSDIEHVMDDCGGVGIYTIESINQLELISECAAQRDLEVQVLIRVTSGNQFGLDESDVEYIIKNRAKYPNVHIRGLQCYTGTQKKKFDIIQNELDYLDGLCDRFKEEYGFEAEELEYGPGLPVSYFGEEAYNNNYDMLKQLSSSLEPLKSKYHITLEMGRFLTALCGIYVTGVEDIKVNKGQNYVIIDGGINHVNYYGQAMAMKIPAYSYVKADGTIVKDEYTSILDGTDDEKWTICGSLCTVADLIVKNLPVGHPDRGDKLIFYNIGAYSITEGIYLFLSRKMPKILAYNQDGTIELYRDVMCSDIINSRQITVK
ncbi:MAG: diaminopimelate decarboxylase family protein [Lachnospira sp.]